MTEPTAEHAGIKKIGRLLKWCALVLLISAMLLVTTALQVVERIDDADIASERRRAATAIDAAVAAFGPLAAEDAALLGKVAGLRDATLSQTLVDDPALQQIPLLAGQGPSGTFLTWRRTVMAEEIFRQFAPIRLPIIGVMIALVMGLLLRMRHLVGEIDRQRRLAHQQSRSDPLTGLANRLALDGRLEQLAASGTPFAVVALDLDGFKGINDSHGHAAGDEVLRSVAARLSRLLTAKDLLARTGGDEFVMLCTSRTGPTALAELAKDCIASVGQPIHLSEHSVRVGISLGLVPAGTWHQRPGSLVAMADEALYIAKSRPGSGYRFSGRESTEAAPLPRPLKLSA